MNAHMPPDHYQQGKEWLTTAEAEHARIGPDPKATDRAVAAAQIATAHFIAAAVSWGEPEPMGPPLESVPDEDQRTVAFGPWPQTTPPERS